MSSPTPPTVTPEKKYQANYLVRSMQVTIDLLLEILKEIRDIRKEHKP